MSIKAGRCTLSLENNQTGTFPDTPEAVKEAQGHVEKRYVQIVDAESASGDFGSPADLPKYTIISATGQPADTGIVTVNGVVFEWDNDATVTAGRETVTIAGTTALSWAAFQTKANANTTLDALRVKVTDVIIVSASDVRIVVSGVGTTPVVLTEATANATAADVAAVNVESYRQFMTQVTATGTTQLINTGLQSIQSILVQVRNAAGRVKGYDGAIQLSGGLVFLTNDDGAAGANTVDIASTDIITLHVQGK